MVALSEQLVTKGFAYEKLRSLYFDISRLPDYGKLSGININKIRVGATVDLDEYEKQNPRDFTLFKRSKLSELKRGIYTKTEWGNVRPSWHIKSAAIGMKFLGQCYDVHTSSRELVFPHHENENAIASALTGKPLAKYWVLCDRVLVDGKKLAEETADINLSDIINMGYPGRVIRYWLISSHYRKAITFSTDRLENARRSLKRLDHCVLNLRNVKQGQPYPERDQLIYDLKNGFARAMDNDLNISAALASMFKIVKKINALVRDQRLDQQDASRIIEAFGRIDSVLNIFEFGEDCADPQVRRLITERDQARAQKNWELADKIREQLKAKGVVVQDKRLS
jgi:cysteinyl-tRNA synthetase